MGPLIIDFQSCSISAKEKEQLLHPSIGGVILFSRNFSSSSQLRDLTNEIRTWRPDCLICVDHEGGRVQRFKSDEFTHLPAMGALRSDQQAFDCGIIMAYELKRHGIHLNFAPVLDRDNISNVIGDRGFSEDPRFIIGIASALIEGMQQMNLPACGKHFPGHGSVEADSHIACPVDDRSMADIDYDLLPFKCLIATNKLSALMPAHVVYSEIDAAPAGYSIHWLQTVLKQQLGFTGVVFSDDLSMTGASLGGSYPQRALAAYEAGCDFLLLCNAPEHIDEVSAALSEIPLRSIPDCHAWFSDLPEQAIDMYTLSKQRLASESHNG